MFKKLHWVKGILNRDVAFIQTVLCREVPLYAPITPFVDKEFILEEANVSSDLVQLSAAISTH